MILGAVMLIDSPLPEMRIHLSTAMSLAIPFAAITVFLLSLVVRARAGQSGDRQRGNDRRDWASRIGDLTPAGPHLCSRRILECGGDSAAQSGRARAGDRYRSPQPDRGTCRKSIARLTYALRRFDNGDHSHHRDLPAFLHQDPGRVRARRDLPAGPRAAQTQRPRPDPGVRAHRPDGARYRCASIPWKSRRRTWSRATTSP